MRPAVPRKEASPTAAAPQRAGATRRSRRRDGRVPPQRTYNSRVRNHPRRAAPHAKAMRRAGLPQEPENRKSPMPARTKPNPRGQKIDSPTPQTGRQAPSAGNGHRPRRPYPQNREFVLRAAGSRAEPEKADTKERRRGRTAELRPGQGHAFRPGRGSTTPEQRPDIRPRQTVTTRAGSGMTPPHPSAHAKKRPRPAPRQKAA